jgi:hypothetical protein
VTTKTKPGPWPKQWPPASAPSYLAARLLPPILQRSPFLRPALWRSAFLHSALQCSAFLRSALPAPGPFGAPVRLSCGPHAPAGTAQAGGSQALAETPGPRCRLREPSPNPAKSRKTSPQPIPDPTKSPNMSLSKPSSSPTSILVSFAHLRSRGAHDPRDLEHLLLSEQQQPFKIDFAHDIRRSV